MTISIIKHKASIIKIICVLSYPHLTLKTVGKNGDNFMFKNDL